MKSSFVTSLALAGIATATPALSTSADPVRILPSFWAFNITSLEGPGCPDLTNPNGFNTRMTYGENTMDGSEIYYWHVAYPYLHAAVNKDGEGDEAHVWCETTLLYQELDNAGQKPQADYRLKLHKNGTRMIAIYDLEEGVEVKWKFTYYPQDEDEVVDTITIDGPRAPDQWNSGNTDNSIVTPDEARWKLPKCGSGTIKYRTDLYVNAKEGAKGEVYSGRHETTEGKFDYYGAQQGFSYDWEKCAK